MAKSSRSDETSSQPGSDWGALPSSLFGTDGPFEDFMRSSNPFALFQQNMALYQNMVEIALGSSKIAPDPRDWRFQDDTWTKNPFFHRLSQAYLAMTDAIEKMIPEGLSDDDRARARLATDIVTSAFAPTNTLMGNPAAVLRAIETRGDSVAKGFRNFVSDWLNNEGMPSQVDDSKFQVGKNLGITPGKVVHKTEMFELIQYQPSCETVHEIPVLLIPPQIGRYYFTDLAPGRSFAEYTVSQGLNHFVVSWRNPQSEHRNWGLEDYIRSALEAVESVAAIAGTPKINLISFCAGGILSSIVAGYLAK
jgi:polyhydroxyalkanoate synthase